MDPSAFGMHGMPAGGQVPLLQQGLVGLTTYSKGMGTGGLNLPRMVMSRNMVVCYKVPVYTVPAGPASAIM